MPGKLLLLRLCKFFDVPPAYFVGKDIQAHMELMHIDSVSRAVRKRRDGEEMSDGELVLYQAVETMRETDSRLHGVR